MLYDFPYKIRGGVVCTPGRFLGEPEWAPYFDAREEDRVFQIGTSPTRYRAFVVTSTDVTRYPGLSGVFVAVLEEAGADSVVSRTFKTDYEFGIFLEELALIAAGD